MAHPSLEEALGFLAKEILLRMKAASLHRLPASRQMEQLQRNHRSCVYGRSRGALVEADLMPEWG